MTRIAWLPEPSHHADKAALFQAVAEVAGGGQAINPFAVSAANFPTSAARAQEALARAKRKGGMAKRLFLQGRYNWSRRWFAAHPGHLALCWQGQTGTRWAVMQGARDAGAATLYAELSPLPDRVTLDPRGVNAAGSVPQDPAAFDAPADTALLSGIAQQFAARAPRRTDVQQHRGKAPDAPYVFAPLQVPDDSQMVLFAGWVGGMAGFVAAISAASRHLPPGWHVRLKEHPSARQSLRPLIEAEVANGARIVLDNATDSFTLLRGAQGVVTVNSSMGLQAMFFDKPVIVTGESFFAQPGIGHTATGPDALAEAFANLPSFDAGLRSRFLTWLATTYYIRKTVDGFDHDQIAARLAGDI